MASKIVTTETTQGTRNGIRRTSRGASDQPLTQGEVAEVQKLAYQLFVQRGHQHGHDREDWLKAEAIIRSRRS